MNEYQIEETETAEYNPPAPITKSPLRRLEPIDRLKLKASRLTWGDWLLIGASFTLACTVGYATFQDSRPISLKTPQKQFNPEIAVNFSAEQSAQFTENYQVFLSQERNNLVTLEVRRIQDAVLKEVRNPKNKVCYQQTFEVCIANSIDKLSAQSLNIRDTNTVVLNANEYANYLIYRAEVLGFAANSKTLKPGIVTPPSINLFAAQTSDFGKLLKVQSAKTAEGEAYQRRGERQ